MVDRAFGVLYDRQFSSTFGHLTLINESKYLQSGLSVIVSIHLFQGPPIERKEHIRCKIKFIISPFLTIDI